MLRQGLDSLKVLVQGDGRATLDLGLFAVLNNSGVCPIKLGSLSLSLQAARNNTPGTVRPPNTQHKLVHSTSHNVQTLTC